MCVLALFGVHALHARTHMMIALHILCFVLQSRFMCAANHPPCCKAPSVLQSTLCAAKHQVLQSNLCAAKHHILCAAKVLSVLQSNRL